MKQKCVVVTLSIFFLFPLLFILLLLIVFLWTTSGDNPYTTVNLVTEHGYPFESHEVTTNDGYILELHRIPRKTIGDSPVVLIQPGLMMDSACFVSNLPNQSLAFILSDEGFDVWMGNSRGTVYGRKHKTLNADRDSSFWDFSWEDLAEHEMPSIVDFVLKETGKKELYYIGNSQSGLTMMAMLSTKEKYKDKIRSLYGMAPAGSLSHVKGPMIDMAPARHLIELHDEISGPMGILHRGRINVALRFFCQYSLFHYKCERLIFRNGGPASTQINYTQLPVFYSNYPDSSSTKNHRHFMQMMTHKRTARFDYGPVENIKRYGTLHAPVYNFSSITTPIYLWYSTSDFLVGDKDIVEGLVPQLRKDTVKKVTRLEDYNHFDFHWGLRAAGDIYNPIRDLIKQDFVEKSKPRNERDVNKLANGGMCFSEDD